MKDFLIFLFTPIIELLFIRKKLKIAKCKFEELRLELKQIQEDIYTYSNFSFQINSASEAKNDLQIKNKITKFLYLITILLVCILLSFTFVIKSKILIISIIMVITIIILFVYYLANKIILNYVFKQIELLNEELTKLCNSDKCYGILGNDILKIQIGNNLIPLFDKSIGGRFLSLLVALRYKLTNKYGYIIPNVKMSDCPNLHYNEYKIYLRETSVAKGIVHIDKILINFKNINKDVLSLSTDKIKFEGDFLEDSQNWYWVDKTDIDKFGDTEKLEADEVIVEHFAKIVMDYVEYIFSYLDVAKLSELVSCIYDSCSDEKYNIKILYDRNLWWYILVNLLKEKISIKDICFIAEKITFYSAKTDNWDEILNNIKNDIKKLKDKSIEQENYE